MVARFLTARSANSHPWDCVCSFSVCSVGASCGVGMGAAQLTLLDVAPKQPADERSHAQSLMRRHQSQGQYLGPSGLGPATKTAKNE
jgi:hypothetical protein